ncbi:uncharacterized protein LOC128411589 [Podarcis raffonei]|uniref:uncharacterized protein LOC128411589 n=1 Tax=Podarcis raffonei TaxID=65483 RepID=UPI00232910A3|nr:uncharacterized protein LOC128411589 [Podarcis raffonei]
MPTSIFIPDVDLHSPLLPWLLELTSRSRSGFHSCPCRAANHVRRRGGAYFYRWNNGHFLQPRWGGFCQLVPLRAGDQRYQSKMDKKKRGRQKSLVSRLQLTPENTKVPHMVEGKFIKPKQASMEDVSSAIPSELRTAVYRAEGSKKHKVKAEEGKMGFAYVFSKIHKEKIKPIVGQCTELTEWDQHQSMEYSELGDMNEESSYISDVSTDISIESKEMDAIHS